jgi:heat shock protein HslJ
MERSKLFLLLAAACLCALCVCFVGCEWGDDDDDDDETPTPSTNDPIVTVVAVLQSKTWTLDAYGTPGSETTASSSPASTVTFSDTGGISGHGGCNSFFGTYTADDTGNLAVGSLTQTMMLCNSNVMAQESAFVGGLHNATAYEIQGPVLRIFYGVGQRMLLH